MPIVKIPDCGQGLNLDATAEEPPLGVWSDGENIRFRNGYAESIGPASPAFSDLPAGTVQHLVTYETTSGQKWWVSAIGGKVYADDGTGRVNITPMGVGGGGEAIDIEILEYSLSTSIFYGNFGGLYTDVKVTTRVPHGVVKGNRSAVSGATPQALNVADLDVTARALHIIDPYQFSYRIDSNPIGIPTAEAGTYRPAITKGQVARSIDSGNVGDTVAPVSYCRYWMDEAPAGSNWGQLYRTTVQLSTTGAHGVTGGNRSSVSGMVPLGLNSSDLDTAVTLTINSPTELTYVLDGNRAGIATATTPGRALGAMVMQYKLHVENNYYGTKITTGVYMIFGVAHGVVRGAGVAVVSAVPNPLNVANLDEHNLVIISDTLLTYQIDGNVAGITLDGSRTDDGAEHENWRPVSTMGSVQWPGQTPPPITTRLEPTTLGYVSSKPPRTPPVVQEYVFAGGDPMDSRWTSGVSGGILFMNNPKDFPVFWIGDRAERMRFMPAWDKTHRANAMRTFKNYLVAFGITKDKTHYPHLMKWSTSAEPGSLPSSWDEANVTQDAGELLLSDTMDRAMDAAQLGDALIAYKRRSAYSIRFIGEPFIFQTQKLTGNTGVFQVDCVGQTPVGHVVLTEDDVVLNSGQGFVSIAEGKVRDYIRDNINYYENKNASFVAVNEGMSEVLICIPSSADRSCGVALIWNWNDRQWGKALLGKVTCAAHGPLFLQFSSARWNAPGMRWSAPGMRWNQSSQRSKDDRLLLAQTGKITMFDDPSYADEAHLSRLTRSGMWFDDAQMLKILRSASPRFGGIGHAPHPLGSVQIAFGQAPFAGAQAVFDAPMEYDPATQIKVDGFMQGRFLSLQIQGRDWRLRAIDLDVVSGGEF